MLACDWFKTPILALNVFEEGNVTNISPTIKVDNLVKPSVTIKVDTLVNPSVTEHILLSASCCPKEILA
jgi:hypothetical protein